MVRKLITLLVLLLWVASSAVAQLYPAQYRPPNQNWQQLTTDHFQIVYPQGQDSAAWQTARLLEHEYPKVQQLTGGALHNFPVILTDYNDRSNGLVTSLHFRSEIDIPPIKGKALNPRTGGWLENVVPHELVHALHLNNMGGFGTGWLVNLFSPDLARSLHGASPSGVREGLATYYESASVVEGGGRGNHPYFSNQFSSIFQSPQRWSMGQMVHFPAETRPFNRHYIGGFEFTNWLQNTYGDDVSRDAIDFNIRWPFLGYGVALKHATGQWPAKLFNSFENSTTRAINRKTGDVDSYKPLPIKGEGREIRRPKWLSDSTLVFYGSFYNNRPGFYRYDISEESMEPIATTNSFTDYHYTLSPDRETIIYSYYDPDTIYPNAYKATLGKAYLNSGKIQKLHSDQRLLAPSFAGDSAIYALKTHKTSFELIKVGVCNLTNQSVSTLFKKDSYQLTDVEGHPHNPDSLAIIANHNGNQALWLSTAEDLSQAFSKDPDISFSAGSVYDPTWHPSGQKLLFSADFSGTLQVYEYDLKTNEIVQLTEAEHNAFEPSYSPDGKRIAFIIQQQNEQLPVVRDRSSLLNEAVTQQQFGNKQANFNFSNIESGSWEQKEHTTGFSWLKPRTALPLIEEVDGADIYQYGLELHSSDLLQQQTYSLSLSGAQNRAWYDLTYQNKQFFPGFKTRLYSQPAIRNFRFETENEQFNQSFLRQERSFALSVPLQFTLQQNVFFTGLYVEPEIRQSQLRYFNLDGATASDFSNTTIGNIFGQLSYRLQQNIRDVQPNSGLVFYSEIEHYLRSGSLNLDTREGTAQFDFSSPTAFRGGLFGYLSPLRRWNQSLRIGVEGITQTAPLFNNQSVVSNGFASEPFQFSNNILSLSTRYTIPLFHPDNGGFLIPIYLSNVYLTGFSNTVVDPTTNNTLTNARTVIGGGLRLQFRISNLSLDIGVGLGFEPSRSETNFFIGNF